MSIRTAACACGQLRVTARGEPMRISVCHCLDCQRRTGSAFGAAARFPREDVHVEGRFTAYTRVADSGSTVTSYFCPTCGSTVFYELETQPDRIAVTLGAFADPEFPPPAFSVYESSRHPWIELHGDLDRTP